MNELIKPGWIDITSNLPSKGKFYEEKVYARPYNFAEISSVNERLSLEVEDEIGAYRHILNGLEFSNPEKSINDLFLGDFLFASFYRKVITTGTKEFNIANVIEGWQSDPITLDKIIFRDLKAPQLPVKASILDEVVSFNPVTVGQWLSRLSSKGTHLNVNDMIVIMSDGKCNPAEVFDPSETETLLNVVNYLEHGIEPVKLNITKGGVTKVIEVNLESSQSTIVLPFRGSEDVRDPGIWFGNESGDESQKSQ